MTKIFQLLSPNLNKYMINIIYDYVIPDINKLISFNPSERYCFVSLSKTPIFDIVVKAIHMGYKGFTVDKFHYADFFIKNKDMDDRLIISEETNCFAVYLKNDNRDLFFIHIFNMNILKFEYSIIMKN